LPVLRVCVRMINTHTVAWISVVFKTGAELHLQQNTNIIPQSTVNGSRLILIRASNVNSQLTD